MEDRPVYAYIPPNLSSTGGLLGGIIDTRRVIEGMIGAGTGAVLYLLIHPLLHSIIVFYVCLGIGLLLLVAGLLGVNGEPFSVFLFNIFNYEQRRIFVTLRPPMPDMMSKAKKEEFTERDNRLMRLLRKGRAEEES